MAIHWKIPFKSLRTGTVYTVNVYDANFSGTAVTLKGGSDPFTTDESDDDDVFTPVRTQSGYLRIADDGRDANGNVLSAANSVDALLPSTDTDRPVTLTSVSGNATIVHWRGFLQAENFGSVLYGGTQEKALPVQCVLSAMSSKYVDITNKALKNFAWYIKNCFAGVGVTGDSGELTAITYYFQGGAYARQWLLKEVDPQNFVVDKGGDIASAYDMLTAVEDICQFWGWTVRTQGDTAYFLCGDGPGDMLKLTAADMTALANRTNTQAGSIVDNGSVTISGDVFASFDNEISRVRGFSRAQVTADANSGDGMVIDLYPGSVEKKMKTITTDVEIYGDKVVNFTGEMLAFPTNDMPSPFLTGSALTGYGSLCLARITQGTKTVVDTMPAVRIKKSYTGATFASFTTVFQHAFYDASGTSRFWNRGGIVLHGSVYHNGEKFTDYDSTHQVGRKTMRMKLGIGATRATALWWNGGAWVSNETSFVATVGNEDDYFASKYVSGSGGHGTTAYYRYIPTDNAALKGLVFVDFLGSEDLDVIGGERKFFVANFQLEFTHNYIELGVSGTQRTVKDRELADTREYYAENDNMVRSEWTADCIYASDNAMEFGYGVVINPDGTLMEKATYASGYEYPEQHLANRVANYCATAKKKVYAELRADVISNVTPSHEVEIASVTGTAISISRQWRDDLVRLTVMEV